MYPNAINQYVVDERLIVNLYGKFVDPVYRYGVATSGTGWERLIRTRLIRSST